MNPSDAFGEVSVLDAKLGYLLQVGLDLPFVEPNDGCLLGCSVAVLERMLRARTQLKHATLTGHCFAASMAQSPLPHPRSRIAFGGSSCGPRWMDTPWDIHLRKAVVQSSLCNPARPQAEPDSDSVVCGDPRWEKMSGLGLGEITTCKTSSTHPTKRSLWNCTGLTAPAWRRFSARCLTSSSWTSRVTPVAGESLFWATVIVRSSGRQGGSRGGFWSDVRCAEGRAGRRGQEGGEQAQVAWGGRWWDSRRCRGSEAQAPWLSLGLLLPRSSTRTRPVFPARHRPWPHLGSFLPPCRHPSSPEPTRLPLKATRASGALLYHPPKRLHHPSVPLCTSR